MLTTAEKTSRRIERIVTTLPIMVESRDAKNKPWREVTHLVNITGIGAGFYLSRSLEIGQLLLMLMPIEKHLRRYDFDKDYYSVWGIVRHCHRTLNKSSVFQLGVAFIGEKPPASYYKKPLTIYNLTKLKEDGFWEINEDTRLPSTRRQPRYSIPIEIYIAVCDGQENIIAHEKTVTENISECGASVFSGLQLNVGDTVKVIKQHGSFSIDAVVRDRRVGEDNLPRIHLEFVNVRFPLEGID